MASLNKVFLLGNLTRDPDLRGLPTGQSVCELRLAVSRRYVTSSGQEASDTCFVDIVVWGRSANNCKQYLSKGSQVLVEGRLQLDQWEDRNGGGQRSKLRVVAEQVQFMNRRRDDEPVPGEGGGYPQQPPPRYQNAAPRGAGGAPAPRGPRGDASSAPPYDLEPPSIADSGYDGGDPGMVDDIPF